MARSAFGIGRAAAVAVVLVFAGAPARGADGVREALAGLSAPEASARWRAERELARRLGPDDGPRLASAVEAGDAEVRARIGAALAGTPRHLDLALFLARRPEPSAAVGRAALLGQIALWRPGASRPALAGRDLAARLAEEAAELRSRTLALPGGIDARQGFDLLARSRAMPMAGVVDPELARASGAVLAPLVGTWEQLALSLAAGAAIGIDAAVADGAHPSDPPRILWLRLCRAPVAGRRSAQDQLLEWLFALDAPRAGASDAAAAALGASGWPAALDLLAQRWVGARDRAALAGLLTAAERGFVHAVLAEPRVVAALVAEMDTALAAGDDPFARRIARALAGLPARADDGASLVEPLRASFHAASPAGRRLRLAALGRIGAADPATREFVDALLRGDVSPAVRRDALVVRAGHAERVGAAPIAIASPDDLLGTIASREDGRRLARELVRARVEFPGAWRDAALARTVDVRLVLVEHALASGETRAAADHVERVAREGAAAWEALVERLSAWWLAGERELLAGLVASLVARDGARATGERLEVALGLAPPDAHEARFARLPTTGTPPRPSPDAVADFAAGPVGERARIALAAELGLVPPEVADDPAAAGVLAASILRAYRTLVARGDDAAATQLRFSATLPLRQRAHTALARALAPDRWDALAPPLDLALEEGPLGPVPR